MTNRTGLVFVNDKKAGTLTEESYGAGYAFTYDMDYILSGGAPLCRVMPIRTEPYYSESFFPVFSQHLAEGPLRKAQCRDLQIDDQDDFGLALATLHDATGAVSIRSEDSDEEG